jgi:TolB-like protein/DNA-binding winged helix-turn-helix (wHTH) protein/Tfp pilus assembly protein PilF
MTGSAPATSRFRFGSYLLDLEKGVLLRDGSEVSLRRQSFDVLVHLVRNRGGLVTREELLKDIWTDKVVTDASITQCLVDIRAAIDDNQHEKIRTLTGRGYRFELPVEDEPSSADHRAVGPREVDESVLVRETSRFQRVIWATLALAAVCLVIAWFLVDRDPDHDRGGHLAQTGAAGVAAGDSDLPMQASVVAVLPFDSRSPVDEDIYLAEGLADEILSSLAGRRIVSVIGGVSSFQFRGGSKKDLPRLIEQLGVTHIVDGSIRRSESGLRVSVHLIDVETGQVAWSETYTSDDSDIYTIPEATATEILSALGKTPAANGEEKKSAPDPGAYRAYLAARALLRNPLISNSSNLQRAIAMLEDAVERDPGLAEAWALLALTRLNIAVMQPGREATGFRNRDSDARLAAARVEAEKALSLDPSAVDALLAQAIIDYRARLIPLAEAENRFRTVLDISPENPDVNVRMGMMLLELGRIREASDHFARAAQLDPLNVTTYGFYLPSLVNTGRSGEARRIIESGRAPWYIGSFQQLEQSLVAGQADEARTWLESARTFPAYGPHGVTPVPGNDPAAKERLDGLFERLVAVGASGDTSGDNSLPGDFIAAADAGLILHTYVALLLGAAGYDAPVFYMLQDRLNVDDLYIRSNLFRPAFARLRADPRVMQLFDAGTQLDYWMATGRWPDFCADPGLPYECDEAAQRYLDNR